MPDFPRTELHRHLDVSVRLSTLLELAQSKDLMPRSLGLEDFRRRLVLREPMADLAHVLATFGLFQKVLERPEDLERVAFEVLEDCYREGTRQVELRFSPGFVCEDGSLSWEEALDAFHRGLERGLASLPEIRAGLILIASRDYGPDSAARTVELYLKNRHRLVGIDLAGDEAAYPARLFQQAFAPVGHAKAQDPAGVHVTIHAGEGAGPDSVWEALELLGAERIGHGIRSFEDPRLVKHLIEHQICLEMCPTSNRLTRAVDRFEDHPLKRALQLGMAASINTDDPTVFGVDLNDEVRISREHIGLSQDEVRRSFEAAARASFLPAAADPPSPPG